MSAVLPGTAQLAADEEEMQPVREPTPSDTNSAASSNLYQQLEVPKRELGPPVLRLENVSKTFSIDKSEEAVRALSDITLSDREDAFPAILKGEFVMIRGPSGGGKTTLLNIIGTLDAPSAGTVELMGSIIDQSSSDNDLAELRLKHIGVVFQTFNLIATMSAIENVELPMTLLGDLSEKDRRRRAKQLLALVGLRNRQNHLPSELSGGEQQRVTIARALANNPTILLLDEPTGDLDTATTIEIMDLLISINRTAKTTCIMVTHNPDVECYADRILYVSDGRFVQQAVNREPQRLMLESYQAFLLERDKGLTTIEKPQMDSGIGEESGRPNSAKKQVYEALQQPNRETGAAASSFAAPQEPARSPTPEVDAAANRPPSSPGTGSQSVRDQAADDPLL